MQSPANPPTACYARRYDVLSIEALDALKFGILTSPYLKVNQLSDRFTTTRGFSVVFTRSGISEVVKQFPYFELYLQIALKSACNAFYLNPLVLDKGGKVESHVDCSLSAYGETWTIPNLVSVLYVQVPEDLEGGELILERNDRLVAQISPQFNTLIYFLGDLFHSVNPVRCSQPRISLICEQYNLEPERLAAIPEFQILSGPMMN